MRYKPKRLPRNTIRFIKRLSDSNSYDASGTTKRIDFKKEKTMFGFLPEEAKVLGSEGRYAKRIEKFKARGDRFPRLKHYCWWFIHNVFAHGFLAICPCRASFRFHDWTSIKLNAGIESLKDFNLRQNEKLK